MNKIYFSLISALFLFLGGYVSVYAHGVVAGYSEVPGIEINAAYDTGEPLAKGQVTVYAPDSPAKPWIKASLDQKGVFRFVPDYSIPGNWSIQVRQAGHGAMIHVPVDDSEIMKATEDSPAALSTFQFTLMILCVSWGFIGTALFFSKRKT
ncbi:MAG: hypothetical protein ACLFSF_05390 [Desulfonatronovibrio sp.]